jgi:hypothetical protein
MRPPVARITAPRQLHERISSNGGMLAIGMDDMRNRGLPLPDRTDGMAIAFAGGRMLRDERGQSRREHYG